MESISKILNIIKKFCLVKCEIIEGSIKSGKFKLLLVFNGIIEKGKSMTIKQLENNVNQLSNTVNHIFDIVNGLVDTVNELSITMNKRFDSIDKRLDRVEQRLDRVEQRLDEHDAIFKRNNLK